MAAARKVLVVEDESGLGQSLDRALTQTGCTVVTMANGAEALKRIAAEKFDLVFADAAAPGLGGVEVAAQVKAQRPWIPVVVIAGEADDAAGRRALAAGAAMVLHKPLSAEAIADSARQVLGLSPGLAGYTETAPSSKRRGGLGGLVLSAFVAVGSAIAFPVVAMAGTAWIVAQRAAADSGPSPTGETRAARIMLFFASPFVSLFYMGIMPMVGMMELIKLGTEAEARAGGKRRTGITGMVSHLMTGGRVWIAEGR